MGKNKKYSAVGKVNEEMNGVDKMTDQDFEQQEMEENTMEEKKRPVHDFVAKHKTGLKMAGIGILSFTVGALCGAAGNKGSEGRNRKPVSECPDLIEIDDGVQEIETTDAADNSAQDVTTVE